MYLKGLLFSVTFLFFITSLLSQPVVKKQIFYNAGTDANKKAVKLLQEEYHVLQEDTLTRHGMYKRYSGMDGNVLEQGNFYYGKKDSIWEDFYEGGMLKCRTPYREGIINGEISCFTYEGNLSYKEQYSYNDPAYPQHGIYKKLDGKNNVLAEGKLRDYQLDGELLEYYDNGSVKSKSYFKKGLRDGTTEVFARDGKVLQKVSYKNGKMDGEILSYYSNGTIKNLAEYKEGALNGWVKEYYSNGELKSEYEYKNDVQHGASATYYENGKKRTEEYYLNGTLHGYFKTYYPDGSINTESVIIDGKKNGLFKSYNPSGIVVLEGGFKDGILEGENKAYYDNGQIKHKFNYKNGKKTGKNLTYFPNGNVSLEEVIKEDEKGNIVRIKTFYDNENLESYQEFLEPAIKKSTDNRIKIGEWTTYYPNEIIKTKEFYQNDKLHGERLVYHENGNVSEKEIYSNGVRIGIWFTYYEDGKVKSESTYKSNTLYGNYKSWYANGKPQSTGHYINNRKNGHWMFYNEEGKHIKTQTFKNDQMIKEKLIEKPTEQK